MSCLPENSFYIDQILPNNGFEEYIGWEMVEVTRRMPLAIPFSMRIPLRMPFSAIWSKQEKQIGILGRLSKWQKLSMGIQLLIPKCICPAENRICCSL